MVFTARTQDEEDEDGGFEEHIQNGASRPRVLSSSSENARSAVAALAVQGEVLW